MFDKPDGTYRPIGLYRAVFRIWAKIRKPIWQQWEADEDPNHLFAAGAGRSATDPVWRQAVRAEIA
eukprot:64501-Karenia_brevis.AAC.1